MLFVLVIKFDGKKKNWNTEQRYIFESMLPSTNCGRRNYYFRFTLKQRIQKNTDQHAAT